MEFEAYMRRRGVYILMGGNQGRVPDTFTKVKKMLETSDVPVLSTSALYQSEPWGFESDALFWNQLIEVGTDRSPEDLLVLLLETEKALGRQRTTGEGYTSRTIDLDILYDGDRVWQSPRLELPHPRLHERRFCLVPLCELIPDWVHPIRLMNHRELLKACPDQSHVWIAPPTTT